jgi:hypothetical protein
MALEVIKTDFFNTIDECVNEAQKNIKHIYLVKDTAKFNTYYLHRYALEDLGQEFNPSLPTNLKKVKQLLTQVNKEYCIGIISNGKLENRESILKEINERSIDRQNKRIERSIYREEKLKGLKKKILRRHI